MNWNGTYRFGLEGNDGNNECIATFPADIWDKIRNETFIMRYRPAGDSYQIRVTTGWWTTNLIADDIQPGNELLVDNEDGTWTVTVNLSGAPELLDLLDAQHLLFTGSGYSVEEIYFIDHVAGGGGGAKQDVFWENSGAFLNKIDKMAIFGLHISKILHERTFGRKNTCFLRVLQITDFQLVDLILAKRGLRLEKKSTPFENLALTLEKLACLQKREKGQNLSKKRAQK